jgi:uncharacterized protein
MDIKQKETDGKGQFYIEENGKVLAEMDYSRRGSTHIIIEHTHVDDALHGRGAGKQLLTKAVEWARQENIKIKPLCTFAHAMFQKVKEFQDVLDR